MTIFIATLFLPYTKHLQEENEIITPPVVGKVPRSPSEIRVGDYTSLFKAPSVIPSVQNTKGCSSVQSRTGSNTSGCDAIFPAICSSMPSSEPCSTPVDGKTHKTEPDTCESDVPPVGLLSSRPGKTQTERSTHIYSPPGHDWSQNHSLFGRTGCRRSFDLGNRRLEAAINAVQRQDTGLDITWVGTLGMPTDALGEQRKLEIAAAMEAQFGSLAVFPPDRSFDGHYSRYCKTMLSPVFHGQIPNNPKNKAYQDRSWMCYQEVNRYFADCLIRRYRKGDVIWIHDYHLLLVPSMVRLELPEAEIGFYLHVAFPSSEVFRCLAMRKELLDGILGADLVGFQTPEYCAHFLQTCSRVLAMEATPFGIQLKNRFIRVATVPMGIDPDDLDRQRRVPNVEDLIARMQAHFLSKHVIVARDKLDRSRGVRQKLLAYERFLIKYPQYRDKVVMIQIASPTLEDADLEMAISEIVTRINSRYSSFSHQPLIFLKQNLEYAQYLALFSVADALMITSLREGMNLTSHEYILCQDGNLGEKKHGSLILSEFTGSASLFGGAELSVNPWDYLQCAEAIRKTLEMRNDEKEQRWRRLLQTVKHNSGSHWFHAFLDQLHVASEQRSRLGTASIPRLLVAALANTYRNASFRLLLVDYEGTLVTNEAQEANRIDQLHQTIDTLTSLIADPANVVYLMSGKPPEELEAAFQCMEGLGIIAENGCFVKDYITETWQEAADLRRISEWKASVSKVLEYYQVRIEGSWIEERRCSLRFHHNGNVHDGITARQLANCVSHINETYKDLKVQALPIDTGLVIESTEWNKGTAAKRIFQKLTKRSIEHGAPSPDFLLVIGDSREDEVVYRWAHQLGHDGTVQHVTTVSGSTRDTEAMTILDQDVIGVLSSLRELAPLPDMSGVSSPP